MNILATLSALGGVILPPWGGGGVMRSVDIFH